MRYLYLLLLFTAAAYGQVFTYSGNVTENGNPLPGATVCIQYTSVCTTTDIDGNYTLEVRQGDHLTISFVGMTQRVIKVTADDISNQSVVPVKAIKSNDFILKTNTKADSLALQPVGTVRAISGNMYDYYGTSLITKNTDNEFTFIKNRDYSKLFLELYTEFTAGKPIRLRDYQNTYAQGRSINGEATYQGPETDEIYSWGSQRSALEMSGNATPFYPNGDIVALGTGNGNPVPVYDRNRLFSTTADFKINFSAKLLFNYMHYIKLTLGHRKSYGTLPNAKNDDNSLAFSYYRKKNSHEFNADANFIRFENELSNIGFVYNKAIFANAITPAHFDNRAGTLLPGGMPRNFSRLENNPYYLLNYNNDTNISSQGGIVLSDKYSKNKITNTAKIIAQFSDIDYTSGNIPFAALINTPGYSGRNEKYTFLTAVNDFKHTFDYNKEVGAALTANYQERLIKRDFYTGFASLADYPATADNHTGYSNRQNRLDLNLNINGKYSIDDFLGSYDDLVFQAAANITYSNTFKNSIYAATTASVNWKDFLTNRLNLYGKFNFKQYEPNLQNNNLYFNSLRFSLSQFKQMDSYTELFAPNVTTLTGETNYTAGVQYRFNFPLDVEAEVYSRNVSDMYAPVQQSGTFNWLPAVDYNQKGLEATISYGSIYSSNSVGYRGSLNFTTYKNKVTAISQNTERIPIAGFSDINKNYIVGQPLGVIVGSVYQRDAYNNVVIDNNGYPIVAPEPDVIGNPNPDFVMGFTNTVTYRNFSLNLTFDWSQGGDLWNGTSQTLNYYGVSPETQAQRNTTSYVFNGVTQSGQPNTTPVNFYDTTQPVSQNRWVRYDIGGVAEDAIEDATYFRLNNISLTYNNKFDSYNQNYNLIISAFINNVFIVSKSKTAFASNTMFNSPETSSLDYFNAPMLRMYGLSVAVKF